MSIPTPFPLFLTGREGGGHTQHPQHPEQHGRHPGAVPPFPAAGPPARHAARHHRLLRHLQDALAGVRREGAGWWVILKGRGLVFFFFLSFTFVELNKNVRFVIVCWLIRLFSSVGRMFI